MFPSLLIRSIYSSDTGINDYGYLPSRLVAIAKPIIIYLHKCVFLIKCIILTVFNCLLDKKFS